MATLYSLFYQKHPGNTRKPRMSEEEIADILLQLAASSSRGKVLSPENVELGQDHEIVNLDKEPSLYYTAPEILLGKQAPDRDTALYSVGMLLYFMLTGRSYYEMSGELLSALPELMQQRDCLISGMEGRAGYAEYETILRELTAWSRQERSKALPHILSLAQKYPSTAEVIYRFNGTDVYTETVVIAGQHLRIEDSKTIRGTDGKAYHPKETATLYHRPVKYRTVIEVDAADMQNGGGMLAPAASQQSGFQSGRIVYRGQESTISITLCEFNEHDITQKEIRLNGGAARVYVIEAVDDASRSRAELTRIAVPATAPDSKLFLLVRCRGKEAEITVRKESESGGHGALLTDPPITVKI